MELLLLQAKNEKRIVKRIDLYLKLIKKAIAQNYNKVWEIIELTDSLLKKVVMSKNYKKNQSIYRHQYIELCMYKSHLYWLQKEYQKLKILAEEVVTDCESTPYAIRIVIWYSQSLFDQGKYHESEAELDKAIEISKKLGWTNEYCIALRLKATILFFYHKNHTSAISVLNEAENLLDPHKEEEYQTLINIKSSMAMVLTHCEAFDLAIQYYYDTLQFHINTKNTINIISCYANLAILHVRINHIDQAIGYFTSALEYAQRINNEKFMCQLKIDIATTILLKTNLSDNDLLDAYQHLHHAKNFVSLLSHGHKSLLYQSLSEYYYKIYDFSLAEDCINISMTMAEETGSDKRVLLCQLGKILIHQDRNIETIEKGMQILETIYPSLDGEKELSLKLRVLETLATAYSSQKQYERATTLYRELCHETNRKHEINSRNTLQIHFTLLQSNIKDTEIHILREQYSISEKEKKHLVAQLESTSTRLTEQIHTMNILKSDIISLMKNIDDMNSLIKAIKKRLHQTSHYQKSKKQYFDDQVEVNTTFKKILFDKYPTLTRTEMDICLLIKSGLSNTQIAGLMSKSIRTVENHRNRIRKKLHALTNQNLTMLLEILTTDESNL